MMIFNLSLPSFTCSVKHVSALLKLKTNLSRADRKKIKETLTETLSETNFDDTRPFFSTVQVKWDADNALSSPHFSHFKVGRKLGCTISCNYSVCVLDLCVSMMSLIVLSVFLLQNTNDPFLVWQDIKCKCYCGQWWEILSLVQMLLWMERNISYDGVSVAFTVWMYNIQFTLLQVNMVLYCKKNLVRCVSMYFFVFFSSSSQFIFILMCNEGWGDALIW